MRCILFSHLSLLLSATGGSPPASARSSILTSSTHPEHGVSRRKSRIIELYDELRPSLTAYLVGLGLAADAAEDIIQECFLRLVRHLGSGGDERNLRGWLFRVAHNIAMDVFRGQTRFREQDIDDGDSETPLVQLVDTSLSPEAAVIKQEEFRRVSAAMTRLTDQQRQAVLLRAEGLRYREIAATLGVSTQRVSELVERALTRLAGDV